ncbi:hypothetical protein HS1genome_2202 [Sulfodiicoccus acidiphilus]|uniref:TRASH domain-containing protein n=1 Tax=Sulfodiicoccus acidiphilus TaxID=1670455 RepID=A0A348B6L1_9CREN|nr:hypothetical protein HS1genome_2202 [Sulfodiicoccus acidiphilus]GGT96555.1 hypothetical protein GCM10007116_12710 [Sulfodiicoccus acidiphilus]
MVEGSGCALCGASWGNVWRDVEGTRLFFCCEVCAVGFTNFVERAKRDAGWSKVDRVRIVGDFRGRKGSVESGGERRVYFFTLNSDGSLRTFLRTE